jgi:mRNA-degrading endonuclease RelE of RelBE toxin-antitoxin system
MVSVEVKPEADATARKLPRDALQAYSDIFAEWEKTSRLKLPGRYITHPLRNARNFWTLKLTDERGHPWADLRCIYLWTGSEIVILRFGHWRSIYKHLPRHRGG